MTQIDLEDAIAMAPRTPRGLFARFQALHGKRHGTFTWIARALGRSPEHVSKVMKGDRSIQQEWLAIAELLEALPREQWPVRWQK
jgi:hypothetical protein